MDDFGYHKKKQAVRSPFSKLILSCEVIVGREGVSFCWGVELLSPSDPENQFLFYSILFYSILIKSSPLREQSVPGIF